MYCQNSYFMYNVFKGKGSNELKEDDDFESDRPGDAGP